MPFRLTANFFLALNSTDFESRKQNKINIAGIVTYLCSRLSQSLNCPEEGVAIILITIVLKKKLFDILYVHRMLTNIHYNYCYEVFSWIMTS